MNVYVIMRDDKPCHVCADANKAHEYKRMFEYLEAGAGYHIITAGYTPKHDNLACFHHYYEQALFDLWYLNCIVASNHECNQRVREIVDSGMSDSEIVNAIKPYFK